MKRLRKRYRTGRPAFRETKRPALPPLRFVIGQRRAKFRWRKVLGA